MKRNCIAVLFGTTALITSVSALATDAATIRFTGEITTAGCTVTVNNKSNNESLDMGSIDMSSLTIGDSSDEYRFYIDLNSCPSSIGTASVTFMGTASSANNQYFAIDGANSNSVGLEIKDIGGLIVKPNTIDPNNTGIVDGSGKFTYTAQLVKLADNVQQSDFDVSTAVDISYR